MRDPGRVLAGLGRAVSKKKEDMSLLC
jgi:hypothetical protein